MQQVTACKKKAGSSSPAACPDRQLSYMIAVCPERLLTVRLATPGEPILNGCIRLLPFLKSLRILVVLTASAGNL